jgi:hypothetical protein
MKKEKGFIQIIVIIIIALAALKYTFDFSIIDFIAQDRVKDTISYIWNDVIVFLWVNYLGAPIIWAWETGKDLAKIGWENFILVLDKIKGIAEAVKD